jgi:hypothetical protein
MSHLSRHIVLLCLCVFVALACAAALGWAEARREEDADWVKSPTLPWLIALLFAIGHVIQFACWIAGEVR